jgi:predicted nuclease with TOPRIM domain
VLIAVIIGAIAAAVLAGRSSGSDLVREMVRYWRRALRRHVDDPARREAGQAKLDEFEHEAAAMAEQLRGWMRSFAAVHRRYESTLADYDRLAESLVEDFYPAQVRLIERSDELRQVIGDSAYFEITDAVEEQLRKARAKQLRREAKARD